LLPATNKPMLFAAFDSPVQLCVNAHPFSVDCVPASRRTTQIRNMNAGVSALDASTII
jgi:hypothetical protein